MHSKVESHVLDTAIGNGEIQSSTRHNNRTSKYLRKNFVYIFDQMCDTDGYTYEEYIM